jgi:integrase
MPRQSDQPRLLPPNTKAIQSAIKASTSGNRTTEYRIDGARGLVLHVMPSGTATWYFHYDVEVGKKRVRRKLKIGRLDEVSLAQARAEVDRLRPLVRQGHDPALKKADTRKATTFAELAAQRFEYGEPLRPGTRRDYTHLLKRDILPMIGDKPARSITREDIIEVLDQISTRGATRRSDSARAVISSIFGYALDRGLVSANPASGLRNRHDYQPRDVVASEDDIQRLWSALDRGEAAMSSAIATIVKLALLTGLRRTEVAAIRKGELDLDSSTPTLTIPRGRAKNRNAHRVPLCPKAAALLRGAIEDSGGSEFVFPGDGPSGHIASRSVSKAMERTRAKLGIPDITMHDLRRTAGTYMSRLGVPKDVPSASSTTVAAERAALPRESTITMSTMPKREPPLNSGQTRSTPFWGAGRRRSTATP